MDMWKPITLPEFVAQERARLERFESWWNREMAKGETSPDGDPLFPAELPPGEWDSQFMDFAFEDGE